jgi:molybdopterin/thiamine biosynthesis adenylyltransferase
VSLSEPQIRRYARHILLPDVGGVGQGRLLAATARVEVGPARPAAAVALAYLAAAGVGTLVVVDAAERELITEAEVEVNIVLGAADVGGVRLRALAARLTALNPDVRVARDDASPEPTAGARIDVRPEEPPAADVAGALAAGGAAAVRALVELARGS